MRRLRSLRYFAAVSPPSPALVAIFGVLSAGAAALEAFEAGSSDWVLASIALLQTFAAATGFTRHASRGRYDPVLVGESRVAVALAHFAVSAAPGAAAWLLAGLAQAVAAGSTGVPALRPAGWATLLLVSAVPWAAGIRTPPHLPGALWALLSGSLAASGRLFERLGRLRVEPGWAQREPLEALGTALAFPLAVPSFRWPAGVLLALTVIAAAALAGGVAAVTRADVPLAEEGS